MRTLALLLGCTLALAAQAQSSREIWKWVDENGVTQYSDQPRPGATRVEIVGVTPSGASSAPRPAAAKPAAAAPAAKPATRVEYEAIEILQPMQGESFYGSDTAVPVRVRLEPELGSTDSVRLYVDGALVQGYEPDSLEFSLTGLERGAHSMTVVVTDQFNKELIRSEPLVFHVKLPSTIDTKNVGPNLRPKPQPKR